MKEKMRLLIELQVCDNRIREVQTRKAQGPLRIQQLRQELAELGKLNQVFEEQIEALKKQRRKVESEVQDLEGKVEKSGSKLASVKTNKEYTAALKEIEDLKNLKFSAEDRVIQLMEESDQLDGKKRDLKAKKEEVTKRVEVGILAIERELGELGRELEGLQAGRDRMVRSVDKDLLKRYLLLMERKHGQAVCAVIRGVCQTCHIGFPPQRFNELIRGESVITCPNCNRLVYWGEEPYFQIASDKLE